MSPAIAPPLDEAELTPGRYIQLRREAAQITLRQAAKMYAYSNLGADVAEPMLAEAERNVITLGEPALRRLAMHVPFDVGIYLCLADGLAVPPICVGCGCSWRDPCADRGHAGPCAWADNAKTLCTACAALERALA